MNKNELIAKVAEETSLSKTNAGGAVDSVLGTIMRALEGGDEVRLVGFGTFYVSERKETEGRDPRTKKPIRIPACKNPKFKAGKSFKEAVNP